MLMSANLAWVQKARGKPLLLQPDGGKAICQDQPSLVRLRLRLLAKSVRIIGHGFQIYRRHE